MWGWSMAGGGVMEVGYSLGNRMEGMKFSLTVFVV